MKHIYLTLLLLSCLAGTAAGQGGILVQDFSSAPMPGMPSGWTTTFTSGGFNAQGWITTDTTQKFYDKYIPVTPSHNKFAVVNDWFNPYNSIATMTSPTFSLLASVQPYLSFSYYYFAGNNGNGPNPAEKAWIDLSTNGGSNWTTIDTFTASGFAWKNRYLSLGAYAGQSNVRLRFVYRDGGAHMYGLALDNIKVFNASDKDLLMVAAKPVDGDPATDFFMPGQAVTFGGTLFNMGIQPVTAFTVTYQVGAGAPVSITASGVNIPPFANYPVSLPIQHTIGPAGRYPVKLWVTIPGDGDPTNDTAQTFIYSITHRPKKRVFFEEGTGTWCGYCVRGIIYMDSLQKRYDTSVSIVAVHSGYDPMALESDQSGQYDEFLGQAIGYAYPSIRVDRYTTGDPIDVFQRYGTQKNNFGLAELELTNVQLNGNNISVSAKVTPATDLQGDYRLQLVLSEDDVHSADSAYAQHNYYSYQDQNLPLSGMGYNFRDSVKLIPATSMYYDHVARTTVPELAIEPNGVPGSLPATMSKGVSYSYTFNQIPLSTHWVKGNIRPIVLLINNANGYVYNSAVPKSPLSVAGAAAMTDISMDLFPNPASRQAIASLRLNRASQVGLEAYDMQGRLVWQQQASLAAGKHQLTVPADEWAPGVYQVTLRTEGGRLSRRLVVVR